MDFEQTMSAPNSDRLILLRNSMKKILKESRYQHSIGVEEVSCDLAIINGYDPVKASITGILHDCAKNLTDEELLAECIKYHLPITEVEAICVDLLHAKVGAIHAKEKYGVMDEDIYNAITYHTTGRPGMSLLEKIVFIADYIEPYRKLIPGINEIRVAAYENLDLAVYMITENTLKYLDQTCSTIDTLTNETYEYYKQLFEATRNERRL
ncbi:MAG: bis(5'-nucleosyl)-tetraphosphatase (symmetrical) YqeK [Mobilitalea sp.]